MLTALVITSFVALFLLGLVLWGVFLARGLRWGKVRDITLGRILLTMLLTILLQVVWESLMAALASAAPDRTIDVLRLLGLAGGVALSLLAILIVFRTRVLQTVQVWLMTLVPAIVLLPLLLLVWRPLYFEAFISPTNAMAPTLLGHHLRGVCSTCGQSNYCSPQAGPPFRMICDGFHVDELSDESKRDPTVHWADRFLVAKFLKPQRWDIIAFENPGNRSQKYVMRLVGLPGETIEIRDGAVWANGKRLPLPPELEGLEYASKLDEFYPDVAWGTLGEPAVLGPGEHFVLGDFSVQSNDSRLWRDGAPESPPYAVPQSHVVGVLTHIYWPPWRMKAFR